MPTKITKNCPCYHITITIKVAEVEELQKEKDFLHLFPFLQNYASRSGHGNTML